MKIHLWLYQAFNSPIASKLPGSWRLRRWGKTLVKDRYFLTPYLEGKVLVCPVHAMGKQVFNGEVYEPTVVSLIRHFIRSEFSFIDIGANIGLHTLAAAFARVSEDQRFFAYEPETGCYAALMRNCQVNDIQFVECKQEAVGDKEDYLELNVSTTLNKGNHTFLAREGTTKGDKVKVSTLDSLYPLQTDGVSHRKHLVKIDVEGYEWPVIMGGMNWFKAVQDLAIICEITPKSLELFGKTLNDLYSALHQAGFTHGFIIRDEDTIDMAGGKTKGFFNTVFVKGNQVQSVLNKLPADTLGDFISLT